jgi:2-furoyl-CoA dehydrogenase 2Fe-2S iron sulfur subunit
MRRVSRDQRTRVTLTLNGRKLSADAEPRLLLSDFLRHALGATGTHVGCEHGICGCCTVMIDGVAQRSCLTLAVQVEGREVQTVESLAAPDGTLLPQQSRAAMWLLHAGHPDVVHRLSRAQSQADDGRNP